MLSAERGCKGTVFCKDLMSDFSSGIDSVADLLLCFPVCSLFSFLPCKLGIKFDFCPLTPMNFPICQVLDACNITPFSFLLPYDLVLLKGMVGML